MAELTNYQVNPYLECVIETNPDAIEIAQRMDEERKQGKVRGKLHGIPVLVKDVCNQVPIGRSPANNS